MLTSLSGHDDHLDDLVAVDVGLHAAGRERERSSSLLGGAARRRDAVADLAVDLADELERVGASMRRVGVRPRLLPHAPAGQLLVDLGAEVRREREHQRGGGRGRRTERAGAGVARGSVDSLTSSMTAAIAVLKAKRPSSRRSPSRSPSAPCARASSASPSGLVGWLDAADAPCPAAVSAPSRQSRPRNRCTPSSAVSDQSASWSGGPMNRM